jgi:nucleolar complex protein 3
MQSLLSIKQLHRSVDILLDPDSSVGQGMYFPELEDPEYCNASNTALWELIALQRHYHPTVRKFAHNVLLSVPATGDGCLPQELSKL